MRIRLKQLEEILEDLLLFNNPKLSLEQYNTPSHIAEMVYGDIEGKIICDLGCGTGTLSIAASILGANFVVGIDIDVDALDIFNENKQTIDINNVDTLMLDVNQYKFQSENDLKSKFDTVIMNPPFGTKEFQNIELKFLQFALNISKSSVYSLMTADHLDKMDRFCKKQSITMERMSEISYNLDRSYATHKKTSKDICVKLLRFYKHKKYNKPK